MTNPEARPASLAGLDPSEPAHIVALTLTCAVCGSVILGESEEAARGLAWLHMQDCRAEGVSDDAPTPEAAAREAVWGYLRDYPDCSITWTECAYIAQLAVEAWKEAAK